MEPRCSRSTYPFNACLTHVNPVLFHMLSFLSRLARAIGSCMVITRSGTFTISRVHLYVHGFILYACIYFSYAQLLGIHTILKRLTELDSAESLSHRSIHCTRDQYCILQMSASRSLP